MRFQQQNLVLSYFIKIEYNFNTIEEAKEIAINKGLTEMIEDDKNINHEAMYFEKEEDYIEIY